MRNLFPDFLGHIDAWLTNNEFNTIVIHDLSFVIGGLFWLPRSGFVLEFGMEVQSGGKNLFRCTKLWNIVRWCRNMWVKY